VGVAGVKTYADGGYGLEAGDEFGDLFKAAAKGEFGACSVFNEDMEASSLPREAVDGPLNGFGSQLETFIAGKTLP
jgi:hypothetical protein